MPRFAILIHNHPFLHWDLLLENGDSCRTWRMLVDPEIPADVFLAESLPDHRLMYLEYEGPVGGQRGSVTQWDSGRFDWQLNRSEVCEVTLAGHRWNGFVRLERVDGVHWKGSRSRSLD